MWKLARKKRKLCRRTCSGVKFGEPSYPQGLFWAAAQAPLVTGACVSTVTSMLLGTNAT